MTHLHLFLLGIVTALSSIAGVLFMRYWHVSRDRFFLWFAVAFVLLALNWGTVAMTTPATEARHWAYAIRLLAFLLILGGTVDKNRRSRS
jgi:hypothetical protein